jgi:diguanylate cyclase (GGDEF)-like protein
LSEQVFEDLKQTGRLPSPHGVALRLLELANREDVSAAELARVLQSDPALAGRVLRAANSSLHGLRPVVSVADAVIRVGFRCMRQLAMGFSLIERCDRGPCDAFPYELFWSRALATAVAAQQLGRLVRGIPPDESFTLGLLHDIGSLALATLYPRDYGRLLKELPGAPDTELRERERQEFRVCHRELSRLMLEDWHIPASLALAVEHRGEPVPEGASPRTQMIADLLELACRLGRLCSDKESVLPTELTAVHMLWTQLGLESSLEEMLTSIAAEWQQWGEELHVRTRAVPSLGMLARGEAAELESLSIAPEDNAALEVLLVEDSDSQRLTARALLESLGLIVREAHNGLEALAQLGERHASIIITDLLMPELDGIGLCRAVRATTTGPMSYIIILTGIGDQQKIIEAFDAGADDFLPKPVDRRELEARLRAARRVVELQWRLNREAEQLRELNTRLEVANQQLASAALTDPLTGLPNRRYLLENLSQEWARTARQRGHFAMVFVDLDHFKRVNDELGHDVGDVVLERVARVLRRQVRAGDTVGRFGGEEFLILCPGSGLESAKLIAERIRRELAAQRFNIGGTSWTVTASFGVAAAIPSAAPSSWDETLKRADAALYAAKHSGRDRVCD